MVQVEHLDNWRKEIKKEILDALDEDMFEELDTWLEVYKMVTNKVRKAERKKS